MTCRYSACLGWALVFSLGAAAQDNSGRHQADPPRDDPLPGLLEFLGEFQTRDGEWIDPRMLVEMGVPDRDGRPSQREVRSGDGKQDGVDESSSDR